MNFKSVKDSFKLVFLFIRRTFILINWLMSKNWVQNITVFVRNFLGSSDCLAQLYFNEY